MALTPQLQDIARQNGALSRTPMIPLDLLRHSPDGAQERLPSFDEARNEFARCYLVHILRITGGNVSQAAKLAQRNRTDFYRILQRYVLIPSDFKGQ
jgi:two-component system response regulator GlrR